MDGFWHTKRHWMICFKLKTIHFHSLFVGMPFHFFTTIRCVVVVVVVVVVLIFGGFQKWGPPKSSIDGYSIINKYKPSIYGYLHLWLSSFMENPHFDNDHEAHFACAKMIAAWPAGASRESRCCWYMCCELPWLSNSNCINLGTKAVLPGALGATDV